MDCTSAARSGLAYSVWTVPPPPGLVSQDMDGGPWSVLPRIVNRTWTGGRGRYCLVLLMGGCLVLKCIFVINSCRYPSEMAAFKNPEHVEKLVKGSTEFALDLYKEVSNDYK